MTWGAPLLLLLGGLWLQPARAGAGAAADEVPAIGSGFQGSHSLRYFRSALSEPLPGIPQFSSVGYVDDVPITSYTSETHKAGPRAQWMEKMAAEEPQYWERCSEINRGAEQLHKADVRTVMDRFNQTEGLHVYQVMHGCELREDGAVGGFRQYAFDGHDFISFDKDRLTWTAAIDAAKITQDRLNSEGSIAQYWKEHLEGRCIEYLKKYLKNGAESLQSVAPQTMVSRRKNGDRTFLIGYAYGFYPREIEVKWVRNGVAMPCESREILPNPDGTYQVRTTVEVLEGDDEKMYRYEVYHSSLPDTVTVMYEEKSRPMGVIIGGVIGALVGVGLIAAVVWAVYSRIKTSGPRPGEGGFHQPLQQQEAII
ncbi:major histocompatibility complex class I-related protein 1-like [Lissotriton helveticus]